MTLKVKPDRLFMKSSVYSSIVLVKWGGTTIGEKGTEDIVTRETPQGRVERSIKGPRTLLCRRRRDNLPETTDRREGTTGTRDILQ